MQFREIARGSAEEARLLDSTAERHGAWIHQAAALLERWFLLGSEWAPGLKFVGGETSLDFARRLALPARSMSVGAARTDLIDTVVGRSAITFRTGLPWGMASRAPRQSSA